MHNSLVKSEDFKDSPLGRIPIGWEVSTLGERTLISSGSTPNRSVLAYWEDGTIPWVKTGEVNYTVIQDTEEKITKQALNATSLTIYPIGTVLLAMYGQGLTRGKVGILGIEATTNQACAAILPKDKKLVSSYLFHYLTHHYDDIRNISQGSNQSNLNESLIASFRVRVPPAEEQNKIAEILDTMDEVIAHTESLIAKLKKEKAGKLHDLLRCGLDENGQLRNADTHPEQFKDSQLGRIPKGWEVFQLGSLTELITSGSRGWAAYYSDRGAIFLRIGNLTREHLNFRLNDIVYVKPPASSEGARARVKAGDVLISITADLGIVGVVPEEFRETYVNQHIALVRLDQSKANPLWVGNYLSGEVGQKRFYQLNDVGAKSGLNLSTVGALLVALPPMQEQEKIANIINYHDNRIRQEEAYLSKLKLQKKGLMHDLLTGKVRVKTASLS